MMNITALTSTNLDPKYLSCAKYFVKFWLNQSFSGENNYKPLVIVIANEFPDELVSIKEYCVLFNSPDGLSDVFTSQFVRSVYASLVKSELVLTTDIDMFPLSLKVFEFAINSSPEPLSSFHVCRDVLPAGQYAICYNLAAPSVWGEITGVRSIEDMSKILLREFARAHDRNKGYSEDHGGVGWYTDQEFLYRAVDRYEREAHGKVLRFSDEATGHYRLARTTASFPIKWFLLPLVLFDRLTDYHIHLPVSHNRTYIFAVYLMVRAKAALEFLTRHRLVSPY
jgi:hypothetical protein